MKTDSMRNDAMTTVGPRRRVHCLGPAALLVDCADLRDVLGLHAGVAESPFPGQIEAVPAATTLLLRFSPALTHDRARDIAATLSTMRTEEGRAQNLREVLIPVTYDGADLDDAAGILGCSADEVITRHTRATWTAAFSGFAPGFSYLVQRDPAPETALTVPRRDSPRTKVPAGSVALAGDFSAVYPSESPGGWQLIGRTDATVWDLDQDPPAMIVPGAPVRFVPARDSVELQGSGGEGSSPHGIADNSDAAAATATATATAQSAPHRAPDEPGSETAPALRIDSPGLSTLIQDAGRPGHSDWGVSPSGWADPAAARLANELLGNDPHAPALENTAGQFSMTALRDVVLAVTGARTTLTIAPPANGDGADSPAATRPAPLDRPFALRAGEKLSAGATTRGLRVYVAVRGGLDADPVLGSASTDTLAPLGPAPTARGTELRVGREPAGAVVPHMPGVDLPAGGNAVTDIRVTRGPRTDWFTEDSLAQASVTVWRVTEDSNRVGARLKVANTAGDTADGGGPETRGNPDAGTSPLRRAPAFEGKELPSEGLAAGSIQIPPSGEPIVFLADRPVTGGYPVVGIVDPRDLRLLAQATPGTLVRLRLDTRGPLTSTTALEEPHA